MTKPKFTKTPLVAKDGFADGGKVERCKKHDRALGLCYSICDDKGLGCDKPKSPDYWQGYRDGCDEHEKELRESFEFVPKKPSDHAEWEERLRFLMCDPDSEDKKEAIELVRSLLKSNAEAVVDAELEAFKKGYAEGKDMPNSRDYGSGYRNGVTTTAARIEDALERWKMKAPITNETLGMVLELLELCDDLRKPL